MSDGIDHLSFHSPIGHLTVFAVGAHIIVIEAGGVPGPGSNNPLLAEARAQIDAYFDGKRTDFDLPLAPNGTPRQREIWQAMSAIPYGETRTYGDLARDLGSAARAIGGACGANPIPLVIPCHRVLGAGGTVGGYSFADGADTKQRLLALEGVRLRLI